MTEKGRPRRKQWIALIIGAVVLMLVFLQGMRSSSSEKAEVVSGEESQAAPPRLALQNPAEKPAPTPTLPPLPKEVERLVSNDAPRSYQEAFRHRQLKRLDERWQGEGESGDWTSTVRQKFQGEFQRKEIPGELSQVSCRQTLCKLQIAFGGWDDAAKLQTLDPDAAWYTDYQTVEGGQEVVTAYLAAPGVDLREITNGPFAR